MSYISTTHHRRSIRLKGYDYSRAGAYFITINVQNRLRLLGKIEQGIMQLSHYGNIVHECWEDLTKHYPHILLDEFIIMPDHLHGIIILEEEKNVRAGLRPAPAPTLTNESPTIEDSTKKRHGIPEIIRALKSFSARRINEHRNTPGVAVWQRNYYEHVIRNEQSLHRIRSYIRNNPLQWYRDNENPDR